MLCFIEDLFQVIIWPTRVGLASSDLIHPFNNETLGNILVLRQTY